MLRDFERRLRKVEGRFSGSSADTYRGRLLGWGSLACPVRQKIAVLACAVGRLEDGESVLTGYARALGMSGVEELQQALRGAETWADFRPVHEQGMRRLWAAFGRQPHGSDYTRDPEASAWMDDWFHEVPDEVWRELGILVVLGCEDFNA